MRLAKSFFSLLKVVPLPVGNWQDLTPAAYQALALADVIICEDTRVTGNMFKAIRQKQIKEQLQQFCQESLEELPDFAESVDEDTFTKFNKLSRQEQSQYLASLTRLEYLQFKYNLLQRKKQQLLLELEGGPSMRTQEKVLQTRLKRGRGILIPLTEANQLILKEQISDLLRDYNVVLVCDRGVPGVSDPGQELTRLLPGRLEFVEGGGVVSMVKGPKGIFFSFREFQVSKVPQNQYLYFFQNHNRIVKRLLTLGSRVVWLSCELTKLHQRTWLEEGEVLARLIRQSELKGLLGPKGEIVAVVMPRGEVNRKEGGRAEVRVSHVVRALESRYELSEKQVSLVVSRILRLSVNRSRSFVKEFRKGQLSS